MWPRGVMLLMMLLMMMWMMVVVVVVVCWLLTLVGLVRGGYHRCCRPWLRGGAVSQRLVLSVLEKE